MFKLFIKSISGRIWIIVSAVIIALVVTVNVLSQTMFYDLLSLTIGAPTPIYEEGVTPMYIPQATSKTKAYENAAETNIDICKEGFVLLKNKNDALPVKENAKVTIFGKNSVNLVYGGSGSGGFEVDKGSALYNRLSSKGIDLDYKTIYDALDKSYKLNPNLKPFYEDDKLSGEKRSNENTDLDSGDDKIFTVGETPINMYTQSIKDSYKDYNDLAIVVLTRLGGEGADLPRHQGSSAGAVNEDAHYLELDKNEIDMLNHVCVSGFKKVVVLFNIPSAMEADFLYDTVKFPFADKIDSALWIGYTGRQGIMALDDILTGKVSPSGKTVDTWAADMLSTPSSINFGTGIKQTPVSKSQTADQYNEGLYYFVNYEEGIYVGYRYYETRYATEGANGDAWYNKNVTYPLGYGLSYIEFEWAVKAPSTTTITKDGTISVNVEVTNKGDQKGKDVVQVYVSAPYKNGIEKSHKVLAGFAKTKEIQPGKSDTVTITLNPYDFASYDYRDANKNGFYGYELEKGDYKFYVSKDAHNSAEEFTCTLSADIRYDEDPVTKNDVGNRYTKEGSITKTDITKVSDSDSGMDKILSRSDWDGTWPTFITDADRVAGNKLLSELKNVETNNPNNYDRDWAYPDFDEPVTVTVRDLLPETTPAESHKAFVDYDDERWEAIIVACNSDNLIDVFNQGAYQSKAISKVGMPGTIHGDGPSGFTCLMNKERVSGTNQYCSEPVFASTWNAQLIEELGKAIGDEGIWGYDQSGQPYSAIYAPGVNIHRSQFGGRCSEYMSEDPFLTGKIAAAEIRGLQSRGVVPMIKHFVANDQETHRGVTGDCTWLTEQSLREIYLKAFEIAIKDSDCRGLMTSFNRIGSVWTGGDYRLCTEILRDEWGFKGCIICDFNTAPKYMDGDQMAYAGGDINLQTNLGGTFKCDVSETGDSVILQRAAKNIMYAMVNSNAMNGIIIGYKAPAWIIIMYVVDGVLAAGIVAWFVLIWLRLRKRKTIEQNI